MSAGCLMEGSDASLTTKDRGNLLLCTSFGRSASQTTPFHRSVVIRNQINQKFASKPVFAAVRGDGGLWISRGRVLAHAVRKGVTHNGSEGRLFSGLPPLGPRVLHSGEAVAYRHGSAILGHHTHVIQPEVEAWRVNLFTEN